MIIVLFGAILPFILWPIEYFLPFPYLIEEAAKGVFAYLIIRMVERPLQWRIAALFGLLFALSESVFYIFNILLVGTSITYFERLALTIPLHAGTMVLILLFGQKKREFIPIGVLIAVIIHYYFNLFVGKL